MRIAVLLFSCSLVFSSAALTLADYSQPSAQSPLGINLSHFYLQDDFWSIENMRPKIGAIGYSAASKVLGAVLNRDASSAYRWTDMAEVLAGGGNRQSAEYCYRRAGELAPHDPQILMAVGNFYVVEGNRQAAVAQLAAVLSGADPGDVLTNNVFVYYERLGIRENGLLDQAIPDAVTARDYMRYLIRKGGSDPVDLWQWMQGKNYSDELLTIDYTNFLLQKRHVDAAEDVWAVGFAGRKDGYSKSSPLFNGGFEYEFTGGVPDWRFSGPDNVKVKRDHASRFDGQFALRVDFTGNDNPDFHHVEQTVFVEPGTYRFEAHLRTKDITSDQGIGFRLVSAVDNKTLAETETLTGTNDWKRLGATMEVPRENRLVYVQLTRRRSIRIDNQLTGTAWIDAVRLTRAP
jgi:hypothetical protein